MPEIAPIRRSVHVRAPVDTAFALFTSHIGAWWPKAAHSVFGEGSLVAFEGDRLVERSNEGVSVWAEVVEWDPPHAFHLAWHAGTAADRSTDLRVSFSPAGGETLVALEHSGWERAERPEESARNYGNGWPTVLARFGDRVSEYAPEPILAERGAAGAGSAVDEPVAEEKDAQWYTLVHTPGPLLSGGESLFAHPMFAEHVAFLMRLRERGLLVAAGPVVPERGEGMTIVRVEPDADVDVVELATRDDRAVVGGLLVVDVRPWDVRFAA
jgi:uncharacterized protein YciI